jgi:ankyrin repeat protein
MRTTKRVATWLLAMTIALPAVARAAGSEAADAAERRDATSLRAMLGKKVDVNTPQADGTTALHWAVHWNDV